MNTDRQQKYQIWFPRLYNACTCDLVELKTTLSLLLVIMTQGSEDNVNRFFFFLSCVFLFVVIRIINSCSFRGLLSTNSTKKGEMSFPRRKLHKVKAMVPGKIVRWSAALCTVIFSFSVWIWIKPRNISTFSEVSELVFTFAAYFLQNSLWPTHYPVPKMCLYCLLNNDRRKCYCYTHIIIL